MAREKTKERDANREAGRGRGEAEAASRSPASEEEKGKRQALDHAIAQIRKRCGVGAIMQLGVGAVADVEAISTGSISLDLALGVGGIPRGRITEIFGPESSGKTTLALHVIASAQKNGGVAAFIDAEHALDPTYAQRLGVNLDQLLVSQPDSGEQALEIAETLISSNAVDAIVIDSVAALVPRAELAGEMGDQHVGLQARLMSQALRKLTGITHRSNACLIFINQIRMQIGVMFGNPETTTGGRALKFYASTRLDVRRIGSIKVGEQVTGSRTRVKVVKNKVAPPFREAEFDILYGTGISWLGDVLDLGLTMGVLGKSGAWITWGEKSIGQGRDKAIEFLRENPDVRVDVEGAVLAKAMPGGTVEAPPMGAGGADIVTEEVPAAE